VNITTWNVNSVRARLERTLEWLDERRPDVLCMQELKCQDAEFPVEPFRARGYEVALFGQKSWNGVAIASRLPITEVETGIPRTEEARGMTAVIQGIRIVNLYVVNGGELNSDKYVHKLGWLDDLAAWMAARRGGPMVICGDFNIAPADLDVFDPVGLRGDTLLSEPERDRFRALLDLGFADAFRILHPEQRFTWWDYRGNSYATDRGMRIDHHLVSPELAARLVDVTVDTDARGRPGATDHAPVTLHLVD
jgi:exodeoxyribonuclease-3